MDVFWKWLMRANARWVFQALCLALLAVSGWWTWRLMRDSPPGAPSRAGQIRLEPAPPLGLRELFASNGDSRLQAPALSPLVLGGAQPPTEPVQRPISPVPQPPPERPTPKPPPPPPPASQKVALTFRGVFDGPDGTRRALLQAGAQAPARFVRAGESVAPGGWLVREITRERLVLGLPGGEAVELAAGVPRNVEVPHEP